MSITLSSSEDSSDEEVSAFFAAALPFLDGTALDTGV